MWKCKCDCGTECIRSGPHLQTGHTTSCGCQKREKIIERNRKPWTQQTRIKASLAKLGKRGEITNNWQGGLLPLPIRMRYSPEYKKLRRNAYERDCFSCQKCGEKEVSKLNIHHIVPWNDDHTKWFDLTNVITMCKSCHYKEHPRWVKSHARRKG